MIAKSLIIFSLVVTSQSFAKSVATKKNNRNPKQVEASAINFKVVYGEKITYFDVVKAKNGGRVKFSNNLGAKDAKDISANDCEFLRSKVSGLTEPSNKKEFCTRNYIEITDGARQILGCLGAPNKLATEIQETANLLSALF